MTDARFRKFDELLVYLAERSAEDPQAGDMKLNKLLYFIDVEAYRRLGRTITGSRYQHQPHGPTSRSLLRSRENLIKAERVFLHVEPVIDHERVVTRAPHDSADLSVFSAEERALIDEIVARYRDFNGTQMTEVAHQDPGWKMTEQGEEIPIERSLLRDRPAATTVARARQLAEQYGW